MNILTLPNYQELNAKKTAINTVYYTEKCMKTNHIQVNPTKSYKVLLVDQPVHSARFNIVRKDVQGDRSSLIGTTQNDKDILDFRESMQSLIRNNLDQNTYCQQKFFVS